MGASSNRSHHAAGDVPPTNSLASSKISVGALSLGEVFDGSILDEDITIAENLLAGSESSYEHLCFAAPLPQPALKAPSDPPIIPPRRSSFGHLTANARPVLLDDIASSTHSIEVNNRRRGYNATSNTWTSSSGEISDTDDVDNRHSFVQEYNKIASQYGIPVIVPDEYEAIGYDKVTIRAKQGSWIMRRLLKRTSSMLSVKQTKELKHKRSFSDLSLRMYGGKKDQLKDKHLVELVRLCGSSPFYLPTEYAAGTLSLPTCFRATAQYLVQRGPALRGIFRINGSHATVSALYDHYASQDEDGDAVSGTVRCPTLPDNIQCDEHDVASAFKKFLSGLPGGVLGKIWLFEALVSIHNQLGIDPEMTKTRQTKVRARLIACAISSHPSRFQRDLICAVFGLLCMIGRAAETAVREDAAGRPLPTHGLMGYNALGTIFGPLLIGELMDEYDLHRQENLDIGEPLKPNTPPKKEKKSRHMKNKSAEESLLESKLASEKMKVANRVAEMLITHWRDVIRHMKNMGSMTDAVVENRKMNTRGMSGAVSLQSMLRPSASESFFLRRPPDWDADERPGRYAGVNGSPTPSDRNPLKPPVTNPLPTTRSTQSLTTRPTHYGENQQPLRRQRSRPTVHSSQMLNGQKSMSILTPPREDQNESRFDDIDSRLHEVKFSRRKENSQPATSSESVKSSGRQSPATKNGGSPSLKNERSTSTFKAGTFQERQKARPPNVLRKSSSFKANVGPVNENEGYEGSAEEEYPVTRGSVLLKKHEGSDKVDIEVVVDDKGTTVKVPATQGAENVSLPGSEQLDAPIPSRYNGQSPSEQLELVLSIHASPAASDKSSRFARYRATDPAHGFGASSATHQIVLRPSFSPTVSEEYSFNSHSNRNSDDATPTSYNRSRYFKDPLKRISKAEDMASLQSLGQALASSTDGSGSDDHGVHNLSDQAQAAKSADRSASNSRSRSPMKSASHDVTPGRLARSSIDKFNGFDGGGMAPLATPKTPSTIKHRFSNPTNPNNTPVTPIQNAEPPAPHTVPLPVFKGRLNSVRSMAAKFENPPPEKATTLTSASKVAAGSRARAPTLVPSTPSAFATRGRGSTLSTDRATATPSSVLGAYTINPVPPRTGTSTPVLGVYTTNASSSPSRASMKSRNSMKSVRSITMTEANRQRRMDTSENGLGSPRRTPAPASIQGFRTGLNNTGMIANRIFRTSTASSNSQHRNRSDNSEEEKKSTSDKSTLASTTTYGSTLGLAGLDDVSNDFRSNSMLPQGDANASFVVRRPSGTPRKSSIVKILPRPLEPPIAQYINSRAHHDILRNTDSPAHNSSSEAARQSVSPCSSLVSPTFFQPFVRMTPEGFAPSQAGQAGQPSVWQGRGASMLHAQVTNMQKALDAKNEENDNLKRQLATKNSLNDLGTLSQQLREAKREINAWRERALKAEAKLERLQNLCPISVVGQGSSEERGQTEGLLSEANDRLEQGWADIRALEEVGSVIENLTQRMSEVDGAGEVQDTPRAKTHSDTEIRTARQDGDGVCASQSKSSSASSAFIPVSQLGSQAASASNSIFDSGPGSSSGSHSTSDSGDKTSNSNGTTIRATMHRGGMDGVMSSEESERSEQSQRTVLRHTVKRRSTMDLMDFRSEDAGLILVQPLVPISQKAIVSTHVEELAELA